MEAGEHGNDAVFARLFTAHILSSLLCTHPQLVRYAMAVGPRSRFGHWYFPLQLRDHARVAGVLDLPALSLRGWQSVGLCLAAALLVIAGLGTDTSAGSAAAAAAAALWLLYTSRVRTHGHVHNKADTVPWVLLVLAVSPTGTAVLHVKL